MITTVPGRYHGVATRVLEVVGRGVPVLLLHGYSDSADTWRDVLSGLEAVQQRATAVDLPGFGCADRRTGGPLVPQFDAFADDLLAERGPAVLVGNSLGAATALRAAARHPEGVRAVVALNDPLNARHWPARLARGARVPARLWQAAGRLPIPTPAVRWAAGHGVRYGLYGPGKRVDPAVVARWRRNISRPTDLASLGRDAFAYAYETGAGHAGLQVDCPVFIVHGARDRIIPVAASHALHQQLPDSEMVVLPDSGHCPQLDDPAAVVRLIQRATAGLSDTRSGAR